MSILDRNYPQFKALHRVQGSGQPWVFAHKMAGGDWAPVSGKRKAIYVGEIPGH